MILLIDHYDSFSFNLFQAVAGLGVDVEVRRPDEQPVEELLALAPDALILSPGPGAPTAFPESLALIERLPEATPMLGVCLGHQMLCLHHGARLEHDPRPHHGMRSPVHHEGVELFDGLPDPLLVGRYHSLRAVRTSLAEPLQLAAWTDAGEVMAVRHRELPRYGLQFHPESILTPTGERLLEAFVDRTFAPRTRPALKRTCDVFRA